MDAHNAAKETDVYRVGPRGDAARADTAPNRSEGLNTTKAHGHAAADGQELPPLKFGFVREGDGK